MISLILCVPLWFFARNWGQFVPCIAAAVAVIAPQFWAFEVMLDRYANSAFQQGTEFLGIVFPIGFALSFLLALSVGAATSPRRRLHQADLSGNRG